MSKLKSLYHLSIAIALLARITEDNNGLYGQATADIYAICDKETLTVGNSYVKKLNKYKRVANDRLAKVKDAEVVIQLIIDNLSAVMVAWMEINNEKYNTYVKTIQKHVNKLAYYWRNMLNEECQQQAFDITDEIMEKLFKEV